MATKAELQASHERYRRACDAVARAEAARSPHEALRLAEASLPLVHPAVTFQRRFLKLDRISTPTLDCTLRHAPALFLRQHLDAVGDWYAGGTRTEQKALPDLPARLEDARRALERALALWSALAAGAWARLVVDNRDSATCAIAASWLAAGAVTEVRLPGRREYARAGDPRRPATGKCSGCGHLLSVPLARLLEPFPCPGCRRPGQFVAVARPA